MPPSDAFAAARPRLLKLAYRMLGSAAEAEDAVQDAYIRWHGTDRAAVREPAAWLTTVVTRLCVDRLRAARTVREHYVGPWLPEPVLTGPATPRERLELAEGLTMALLVVMEALTPAERAAFILREAFDYDYADIAAVLETTEVNARQLVSRARRQVDTDAVRQRAPAGVAARLAAAFRTAAETGRMDKLEQLLHADVVARSDGGGHVKAARNPILGRDKVSRFVLGLMGKAGPDIEMRPAVVLGGPGFIGMAAGRIFSVVSLTTREGSVSAIDIILNPDKLKRILGDGRSGADTHGVT
ncbi:MAG: RNA polymerase sigma-70 factor [Pseudomonadota bacterium]|nr:RNA polymerase sigma-70 factor [Pseudomonadota bacterium]